MKVEAYLLGQSHSVILGCCFALFWCQASFLEDALHTFSRRAACADYMHNHRHLGLLEDTLQRITSAKKIPELWETMTRSIVYCMTSLT